jgi:hypothetical protein
MGWSTESRQWVSDDGLRCYFSERDPGGPSRLECYRRLLAESMVDTKRRRSVASIAYLGQLGAMRRLSGLLELPWNWHAID